MRYVVVATALILLVSVGAAFSQPLCGALLKHRGLADEIGITDEQREELEGLFEVTERQMIGSHAEMKIRHLELERLMRSDRPDMRQIRKLVNEVSDARTSAMLARIERGVRTREILTREQLKKAQGAMKDRMRAMRAHRGDGRRGRQHQGFRGQRQGYGGCRGFGEDRGSRRDMMHKGQHDLRRPSF